MKITIIYDNTSIKKELKASWGFSGLIEVKNSPVILFDTGGKKKILRKNMKELGINKDNIDIIFISHAHRDHTGGLKEVFAEDKKIYIPPSCSNLKVSGIFSSKVLQQYENVTVINKPTEICTGIYASGELKGIEQSLAIKTRQGLVVIVGCSHPGLGHILKTFSQFGNIRGVIGGFHGFNNYSILKDVELICPTHCTQHKREIISRYPEKIIKGGAGRIIEV